MQKVSGKLGEAILELVNNMTQEDFKLNFRETKKRNFSDRQVSQIAAGQLVIVDVLDGTEYNAQNIPDPGQEFYAYTTSLTLVDSMFPFERTEYDPKTGEAYTEEKAFVISLGLQKYNPNRGEKTAQVQKMREVEAENARLRALLEKAGLLED